MRVTVPQLILLLLRYDVHGSVGKANLPGIVTSVNPVTPWLTSIYGFMGTSMQRRIEIFMILTMHLSLDRKVRLFREAANKNPSDSFVNCCVYSLTGFIEETVIQSIHR